MNHHGECSDHHDHAPATTESLARRIGKMERVMFGNGEPQHSLLTKVHRLERLASRVVQLAWAILLSLLAVFGAQLLRLMGMVLTLTFVFVIAGCAQTEIARLPDGSIVYRSTKNVRAVLEEYHEDGTISRRVELIGDASTVINAQNELIKTGIEIGKQIGGVP